VAFTFSPSISVDRSSTGRKPPPSPETFLVVLSPEADVHRAPSFRFTRKVRNFSLSFPPPPFPPRTSSLYSFFPGFHQLNGRFPPPLSLNHRHGAPLSSPLPFDAIVDFAGVPPHTIPFFFCSRPLLKKEILMVDPFPFSSPSLWPGT